MITKSPCDVNCAFFLVSIACSVVGFWSVGVHAEFSMCLDDGRVGRLRCSRLWRCMEEVASCKLVVLLTVTWFVSNGGGLGCEVLERVV